MFLIGGVIEHGPDHRSNFELLAKVRDGPSPDPAEDLLPVGFI